MLSISKARLTVAPRLAPVHRSGRHGGCPGSIGASRFSPPIPSTPVRNDTDRSEPRRRLGRRLAWCARVAICACVVAMPVVIAACGDAPNPPIAVVQSYLNALGGGEYTTACRMADSQALDAVMRAKHVGTNCVALFRRCLPNRSLVLKSDQTQLLYADIEVTLSNHNSVANADTSATPVAAELKHVTLKHEKGVWRFTGFGKAIEACRLTAHRPRHHPRHKR